MSAAKPSGTPPGSKDHKGDGKGNNDAVAAVTGVVIVTGVAYGLYRYIAGNSGEPLGQRTHAKSEPFHQQIKLGKPGAVEEFEGFVKDAAGKIRNKAGEFKEVVDDKGRDMKYAVKRNSVKNHDVKDSTVDRSERADDFFHRSSDELSSDAEDGKNYVADKAEDAKSFVADKAENAKNYVADKAGKTKESASGWFGRGSSEANKGKGEVKKFASDKDRKANDAFDKARAEANRDKEEAERQAAEKMRNVKDSGSSFLNKVGAEAKREKEAVKHFAYDAEHKVEHFGSDVANKASDLAHKVLPGKGHPKSGWSKSGGRGGEYGIVRGDTLWSISRRYGVSIDELKAANGIRNADFIVAGDSIVIPN